MSTTKTLIITALSLMLFAVSCVPPQSGTATGGGSGGNKGSLMILNGRPVDHEELVKHPLLRQGFQQLCIIDTLWIEFASRGYELDEAEVEERLDMARAEALRNQTTFKQMLRDMGTTENDLRENYRVNQALESLRDNYIDLSEENLRGEWEQNFGYFNNIHVHKNSLTDLEAENLTFEDVIETVREQYKEDQTGPARDAMFQDLIDKSNLSLVCLKDPTEKQFFEDVILNSFKTAYEWPADTEVEEEAAADEATPADESEAVEMVEEAVEEAPVTEEAADSEQTEESTE